MYSEAAKEKYFVIQEYLKRGITIPDNSKTKIESWLSSTRFFLTVLTNMDIKVEFSFTKKVMALFSLDGWKSVFTTK